MPSTELHSVVVPVFREAEGLNEFHRLTAALSGVPAYEVIYVEDHRPDLRGTVRRLLLRTRALRVLRLSRRYGHQVSLTAGMDYASGDTVTVMDGDLQHPPELLPQMIESMARRRRGRLRSEADVGMRSLSKKFTARVFYKMMRAMADVDIPAHAQDFRLMSLPSC